MVAKAQNRIAENPDGYVQKIYGLKEVGGTTVLYLSAVPFENLGFDTKLDKDGKPVAGFNAKLEEGDRPDRTMRAHSKVPYVVGVGAVALSGIWWITNRRHEVEQHEANNDSHNK
jgi:formate dehydrogenase iron-sulfur subunit